MVIALVTCKVVAQVVDPLGEKGDLDRRTPPVTVVELLPLDECLAFGRFHARHGDVCSLRGVAVWKGCPARTDPTGAGPRTRPPTRGLSLPIALKVMQEEEAVQGSTSGG